MSDEETNEQTGWTPEHLMKVRDVTQVRISPDGLRVLFVVADPVMTDEKSEYVTQVYTANADGSDFHPLTFHEKPSGNPQWSPDGTRIAFTSNRAGKNNLYLLRADGGEAEQITDVKADIGAYLWSPDGTQIAFLMPSPPTEEDEKREKGKDDWRWVDEDVKQTLLYVVPIAKDAEGKREPRQLAGGAYNVGSIFSGGMDWSPDGKTIAFVHTKSPKADDWTTADISLVDLESGEIRPLAASRAAEFQPLYSPDGRWIAMSISDDPPRWAFYSTLWLYPMDGGEPRRLPETRDGQPNLIGWSADSRRLYFTESRGTSTAICSMDIDTGEITTLNPSGGVYYDLHLNRVGNMFGFTFQTSERAKEAYVTRVDDFAPAQVSRANAAIPALPLPKTEALRWKSADGLEIEGLLTYPVDYTPGRRVPLLLVIHGGPAGVYGETFTAMPGLYPPALFASRGYAVLRANPRGSSGYGKAFRYANQKDWGGGDYQDLMAGVDQLIEAGLADPDRLGVMGWSYGGFMTSWIITQTHRFKAASVGAAVTNLMSFNGTADIPAFVPDYFGAQSWENLEIYREHCAMFQVEGVRTPALIQHGESDVRVPISQGYEFYNALKQQGVPVRMLVLPRQPHSPNEPKMVLKVMQTNLEWFEKYLGEGEA